MNLILPGEDPMIQRAAQQAQLEQQTRAVVNNMKNEMFVSIFTQLAIEHFRSGDELSLEAGRALSDEAADMATNVINHYSAYMFEKLGMAKLEKIT